jgi:cell division protein FtsI/penicillin-binding protein 2
LILSATLFEKGMFDMNNSVSSHLEMMIPFLRGKVIRDQSILDSITRNVDRYEFLEYCKGFGLGISTGIDLPGEKVGELSRDPAINVNNIMRLTSTTPLQALRTIAIIVNQGKKVVPRLALKEDKEERRHEEKPLLKMTADALKRYLSGCNDNSGRYINIRYNAEYGGLTEHVGFDSNITSYLGYISNMGKVYVFHLSVKGDIGSTAMERVAKEIARDVDWILNRFIEKSYPSVQ